MIHIFGDSHRGFFTDTHPGASIIGRKDIFISHALGAGTAHNYYEKRHPKMMQILNDVPKTCGVVIVAGEIDCRLHIPKLYEKTNEQISTLIENTVHRFMRSLLEVQKLGYKVIAWGPHPTRHLETLDYNTEWYASDQCTRNQICMSFNGCLHFEALNARIPFGTTFYDIIAEYETYTVHDEFYCDPLHLNQKLWSATNNFLGNIYDNYADFQ